MVRCIVKNCKNTNTTCTPEEVSFHKIPENQIMREGWYKNIGEVVLPSNTVNARICSMHFTPESFVQPKRKRAAAEKISKRRSLLPSAIPTLNLLPLNEQASREENNMKVIRREFHLVCPSTSTNTPIRSSTPVPSPAGVTEHSQDLDLLLIDSTSCHETLTSVSTTNRCQEPTNSDNDVQKVSYELSRSDSFPTRSKKKKVVLHKCSTLSLHRTVRSRSKRFTSKTKVHEAEYNSEQGSPPLKRQCRFNKSEPLYTPRILGRRFALTATAYKYLDIGINVGSTSFVELILGDNRGNQIVLPHATWIAIIDRRMAIEQLVRSTVGSSLSIRDLVIELVKMHDTNIVKLTLRDTYLYMISATVLFLFEIEQCVEHVYFNLCQNIQHVSNKYKHFVTILRQNRITDKHHARKVLSEVSDGSSLIDCELVAFALDNIVYEAKKNE